MKDYFSRFCRVFHPFQPTLAWDKCYDKWNKHSNNDLTFSNCLIFKTGFAQLSLSHKSRPDIIKYSHRILRKQQHRVRRDKTQDDHLLSRQGLKFFYFGLTFPFILEGWGFSFDCQRMVYCLWFDFCLILFHGDLQAVMLFWANYGSKKFCGWLNKLSRDLMTADLANCLPHQVTLLFSFQRVAFVFPNSMQLDVSLLIKRDFPVHKSISSSFVN